MVQSGVFARASHDAPHCLFAPLHYEPGYAYPLIVWLHGAGNDETQLLKIMPLLSLRNYVAVAPRGLREPSADGAEGPCGWPMHARAVETAAQRVAEAVELVASRYHVSRRGVFLAGFDAGGTMALRLAMLQPERCAGVLSLCGGLPRGGAVLSNLDQARSLPVFLASGRLSADYPASAVCEDLRLLHAAGLETTLREYPCGHQIAPRMLSDMDRWIIEQFTARKASRPI